MEQIIFIIAGVLAGAILVWLAMRQSFKPKDTDSLLLIQNQLNMLVKTVDEKIGESNKEMQQAVRHQFGESQKLVRDITEQLTRLDETNKQVVSFADRKSV